MYTADKLSFSMQLQPGAGANIDIDRMGPTCLVDVIGDF